MEQWMKDAVMYDIEHYIDDEKIEAIKVLALIEIAENTRALIEIAKNTEYIG